MDEITVGDFAELYARFDASVAALDCGQFCAPHNEGGAPFCCDTSHAVPAAYLVEWQYLQQNTDLWHLWKGCNQTETERLEELAPKGQVLIACQGFRSCQRNFRSLTCRAFPFFPYITRSGQFIGLSCYWEYEQSCWVLNNLQVVTPIFVEQFIQTFDWLFNRLTDEMEVFRQFSIQMRRIFGRRHRLIPLFHRNGGFYCVSPRTGRWRRSTPEKYPKVGIYKIITDLPFPDELDAPETSLNV
jgi:hypothetical protein